MGLDAKNEPKPIKPSDATDLLFLVAAVLATPFRPFLRSRPGTRAYAVYGPLALLYMFGYAGFANCIFVISYLKLWLLAVIFRRVFSNRNCHSNYAGWPWVTGLVTSSHHAALILEPVLLFGVAVFVAEGNPAFGQFVLLGALGNAVVYVTEVLAMKEQNRRITDAQFEMGYQSRMRKGS